ncbi:MAG: sigma-70 family RNA polymerase sigma factor [Bryobacterales bacterium]|nr:sigma-70 family RNA polymerase sigma factor [Bryobacterales bacterium]MBV9400690.1 sigma-70 family RNA polymerase sigma factor [Bryobacterales bacterium]
MNSQSDAELVQLARAGNRDAYDELIRRSQRSIWGLACLLVNDRFEAEDLTQEAFLRAWLNLDLLSDPSKFAPWLRRIVFGVSIDWLRVFRPDLFRLNDLDAEREVCERPSEVESAFDRLQAIELRQRIWEAVDRLPPRYRLPLALFHLDGLSHSKVAEALGVPVSTARSLVTRARQKLRPMLASYAGELLPAVEDVFREQTIRESAMLHITDGESVAGTLRKSGIPGQVSVYGDLMYEGPAPAGLDAEEWREVRARFRAGPGGPTLEEARRYLKACDDALAAFSQHDEVVIWVDHRLSDQLILIKVLDWFSRRDLGGVKLSLICTGDYPGMDRFVGLGQLTAGQLLSLADTRLPVSGAHYRTARAAWNAFTSSDPTEIEHFIDTDTSALPFIPAALRRHLEQFPSADNGLSRTERQALSVLRERGPLSGPRLFVAVQRMEEQIFMGEESFYGIVTDLSNAPHPLVAISGTLQNRLGDVTITEAGRKVLQGRADRIDLNGIDRWLGGVHLTGEEGAWRWDSRSARIVQKIQRR